MSTIKITQVSKLKHGILYQAAKKLGGQSALARHLGLPIHVIQRWCNLKGTPSQNFSTENLQELENKLFALTGATLDEIFPPELVAATAFLNAPKTAEHTLELESAALLDYAERQTDRLTYKPDDTDELRENIKKVLNTLSYREREIISLRFGLDGNESLTLEETASVFKVSAERICQIEAKAIRHLQQLSRAIMLIDFAPERTESLPAYKVPVEVWPSEIYVREEDASSPT